MSSRSSHRPSFRSSAVRSSVSVMSVGPSRHRCKGVFLAVLLTGTVLSMAVACADSTNVGTSLLNPQLSKATSDTPSQVQPATSDCIPIGTDISAISGPDNPDSDSLYTWSASLCGQGDAEVYIDWYKDGSWLYQQTVTLGPQGFGTTWWSKVWACGASLSTFTLRAIVSGGQDSGDHTVQADTTIVHCPNPVVSLSGPADVCPDGLHNYTWTASVQDPVPVSSYQWYEDGTPVGTHYYYSKTPTSSGSFQLKVSATDSLSQTHSDSMTVTADYSWCPHSPS